MCHVRRSLFILVIFFCVSWADADAQHRYGHVDFESSCSNDAAAELNTAVALLHHMMYEQAEEHFRTAADADPDCAMAYWGIAMTQIHPLWAPPTVAELAKGKEASAKAAEIGGATARERGYIAAVRAFFDTEGTFPERLRAWEATQKKVHQENPDDVDAAAFYALSLLATAPKDDPTFAQNAEAGRLLENLLERTPEHPGLFHYTIHAYDNPVLAERAVEVARGYDKLAPKVPHALHMPSHIFVRLGLWDDVAEWNRRSAEAALQHPVGNMISLHYPHAIDYLVYARLQQGRDAEVSEAVDELLSHEAFQPHVATAYALAAVPARYVLERRAWEEAAELPTREPSTFAWEKFPAGESITWYAKGLGAARTGDAAGAKAAIDRLDELHDALIEADETYWAVHSDAQRKAVEAWLLYETGRTDEGLALMQEAADVEDSVDKHPVTPGSVLPARELLGEMLLLADRPAEALEAFEATLAISPKRLNSLTGAGRAAELSGEHEKAATYYDAALAVVKGNADADRPRIADAARHVGSR